MKREDWLAHIDQAIHLWGKDGGLPILLEIRASVAADDTKKIFKNKKRSEE